MNINRAFLELMTRPGANSPISVKTPSRPSQPIWSEWLDHSPIAKTVGGNLALLAGTGPGFARGAWRLAEGVGGGLNFVGRLLDPYDAYSSPRGEAAWDAVVGAGQKGYQYLNKVRTDPSTVLSDARHWAQDANAKLNPSATRPADTFGGELRRNFNIGLNGGETLFDLGSMLYGGAELKGLAELGLLQKGGQASRYLARGYPSGLSEYFATPYRGMGHPSLSAIEASPQGIGRGPVPKVISDSRFNVLKPSGIDTGAFYERHFNVDPRYGGGAIPAEFGGGRWSGKELGWRKYGPIGRGFYGASAPLKAAVGTGLTGTGALVDWDWGPEQGR